MLFLNPPRRRANARKRTRLYGPTLWGEVRELEAPHPFEKTTKGFERELADELALGERIRRDPWYALPASMRRVVAPRGGTMERLYKFKNSPKRKRKGRTVRKRRKLAGAALAAHLKRTGRTPRRRHRRKARVGGTVARRRKSHRRRASTHRRRRRAVMANPRRHRRRSVKRTTHHRRRRNPFGGGIMTGVKEASKTVVQVLGGELATEFVAAKVKTFLPASMQATLASNKFGIPALQVVTAIGLSVAARKFLGPKAAANIMVGGFLAPARTIVVGFLPAGTFGAYVQPRLGAYVQPRMGAYVQPRLSGYAGPNDEQLQDSPGAQLMPGFGF